MTAYDALVAELDTRNALIAALRAENEALRARVQALETALRPFADAGEELRTEHDATLLEYIETDGEYYIMYSMGDDPLTFAHLRAAAKALNPEPQS